MNCSISLRWLALSILCALVLLGCARERGRTDIALEMTDEDSVEAIIDQDLLTAGGTIINVEQDAGTPTGAASTVAYVDEIEMQKPVLVETDERLKPPVTEPGGGSVTGLDEPLVDTRDLVQDTESILADLDVPSVEPQTGAGTSGGTMGTTPGTTPGTVTGTLGGGTSPGALGGGTSPVALGDGTTPGTLASTDMDALAREAAAPALPRMDTGPMPISTPSGYYPDAYRTPLPPGGYQRHTVVRGDSLWSISRKYGCSVSELAAANGMTRSTVLQIGQVLIVPVAVKPAPPAGAPAPLSPAPTTPPDSTSPDPGMLPVAGGAPAGTSSPIRNVATDTYTVEAGDSYWKIARRYGITAQELMALNDTSDSRLKIGQKILVPKK